MTKLVFSFDTEDYINEIGAEGIVDVAKMLEEKGYKGCFQVVARLAEALLKWGRRDIIDLLKANHEIDYHSYAHSMHPTVNEYTDIADFDAALCEFYKHEKKGIAIVEEIFDQKGFAAMVPPGNSSSYVAHYGYAELGIPLCVATPPRDCVKNRPLSACNISCLSYDFFLDDFLLTATEEDIRRALDEISEKEYGVIYHHPQMHVVDCFCDLLNFNGENIPEDKWILSKVRPAEVREKFCDNFRLLLSLIEADPRFEVTTFGEIAASLPRERKVAREEIDEIAKALNEAWFPVTSPESLSLCDCMLACRDFLVGKDEHICEKSYGFLGEPYAISESLTLTAHEIRQSAYELNCDGFLPEFIFIGDKKLGPADWVRAALKVLCGEEKVTLEPLPWQIDLDQFPAIRDLAYKNTWIHVKTLEDRWLSDRFRLQSWTFRLPRDTERFIK